jgi:hypothetical protein
LTVKALSVPGSRNPREGRRFIAELDRRLEVVDRAILVAEWNLQTGRSRAGSDRWQLRRSELLSDPGLLEWVRRALGRAWSVEDRRRLELLERVLLDTQVEQHPDVVRLRGELQRRIVAFRPLWKGKRVGRAVVRQAAREARDGRVRRAAYYGFDPLFRSMEEDLRRLVRMRNERARELGFRTFAEMRLSFFQLTPSRLVELAEAAASPARSRFRRLRDLYFDATGASEWHPWDVYFARRLQVQLPDRRFPIRGMLRSILSATRAWGFRTDRMRFRVVYHDLPAGGLTLAPDPPKDVRILVHPAGGFLSYDVMFHEVGHAIQSASVRAPGHLLKWHENVPGFGPFHEGIGALFEEIPGSAAWLATRPSIDQAAAERYEQVLGESGPMECASIAAWFRPELALYQDPDRDPRPRAQQWWRKVGGFDSYRAHSFADSFFVDAPVYAPNYLLANLFCHQVRKNLRERFGDAFWPNRRIGPWLTRTWFAPGSMIEWPQKIRETTGRPLDARAFREDYPG